MKRGFSIFELYAGLSAKRVGLVLAVMTVIELLLFWVFALSADVWTFDEGVRSARISLVFFLAYMAMFWALGWYSVRGSGRWTMQRLGISEKRCALIQIVYNALCFILFHLFQAVLLLLMAKLFAGSPLYAEGPQGIFFDIKTNYFLCRMLSLREWTIILSNLVLILVSAASAAHMSVLLRNGKAPILSVICAALVAAAFTPAVEDLLLWISLALALLLSVCVCIYHMFGIACGDSGQVR